MLSIILLLITIIILNAQEPSLCPSDSGLVQSARITLTNTSASSSANLIPTENSLTYNYTLSKSFNQHPGVTLSKQTINLGITSFTSAPSLYLMFSAKPLPSTSFSTLSFLLRFYQKYTSWTLIQLSFLAESRNDIEADYYLIGKGFFRKILDN